MYEDHRKNVRRGDRDFDEDRFGGERWSDDEGGWRERDRGGRFETERVGGPSGYGSTFRDDDYGRYDRYAAENAPSNMRGARREPIGHGAHDLRHRHYTGGAASYRYGAGQPYGGEGDSRYFTGSQGSWAMRSPYGAQAGRSYGADYREHGYASHHDDERGFWDRASDEVASWFGDEEATHRRELDHRGKGPKDYVRSDARICEDANERLTEDATVDASEIALTVQNGEITLNGTVASRLEKRRAEDLVDRISGVKHVQNNLRVDDTAMSGN